MKQERLTSVIGYVTDENGNQYNVYGIGMLRDKAAKEESNQMLMHRLIECTLAKKLGSYEDIDEKLKIDYLTLYKAFTNGFWRKTKRGCYFVERTDVSISWLIQDNEHEAMSDNCTYYHTERLALCGECLLEDYGTTWALTKEELE